MSKLISQEAIQLNNDGHPIRWLRKYEDNISEEVWTTKLSNKWEVYKKNLSTGQVYIRTNDSPEEWELTAVTATVTIKDPIFEVWDAEEFKIDISKKEYEGDSGDAMDEIVDGWRNS